MVLGYAVTAGMDRDPRTRDRGGGGAQHRFGEERVVAAAEDQGGRGQLREGRVRVVPEVGPDGRREIGDVPRIGPAS